MRSFTEEELKLIQQDMDRIVLLWERFKHRHINEANVSFHPPPALVEMGRSLADSVLGLNEANSDMLTLRGIVNISAAMFEFGQFCQTSGFYNSNMLQCICCAVDDSELKKFVGEI